MLNVLKIFPDNIGREIWCNGRKCLSWLGMLGCGFGTMAYAQFQPEAIGQIERLPAQYPAHWVLVHDFSFAHMMEGEVLVIDPLATNLGAQYKGMMPASMIASFLHSASRGEHYVVETFYTRGLRGDRQDVVTVYDPATLSIAAEIDIPPKRLTGMPKTTMTALLGGERFLGVYNFTPNQSVSIVDLVKREFVTEIGTPGCGFLIPNGQRSFTSICANGTFLTSHLDNAGRLTHADATAVAFNSDEDPIFESVGITGKMAYFPTFKGQVVTLDLSEDTVVPQERWWLSSAAERQWRPGGMQPVMVDANGLGYFLMHPHGAEGTHKDGGSEVWVYDLAERQRTARIELKNWGLSLGNTGSNEDQLMLVTNGEMGVDVYRIPNGEFVHTLKVGAATPFLTYRSR